jgi:hypothetical protein
MSKIAIMQPYFAPYIGYFQLINAVDKFVFLDDVNFINKGWINRNYIQRGGEKVLMTIPLKNASQNVHINDIPISNEHGWKRKLLTTLDHAYKKAPYYNDRMSLIHKIMDFEEIQISELAKRSITTICEALQLNTQIIPSSSVYNNNSLKGEERILNIVLKEDAQTYINPIGGVELYNKDYFKENGVELYFIQTGEVRYKQIQNDFVPHMSMFDILMFNSNEEILKLLNNFSII